MSNTPPQLLIYSIHTQKNYQQAAKKWEDSQSWARIVIVVIVIVIVVDIVIDIVIWIVLARTHFFTLSL